MSRKGDNVLVREIRTGNRRAFELLMARYERKAYQLAYRHLGNNADAADVVQEAMVKVYRHLDQFQAGTHFSSWLFHIVRNTSLDELRRRSRRSSVEVLATDRSEAGTGAEEWVANLPDPAKGPLELLEREERRQAVWRALNALSPDYREVLVLHHMDDYSCPEIAARLGNTVGAVKVRLHRARQALRRAIESNGALAG